LLSFSENQTKEIAELGIPQMKRSLEAHKIDVSCVLVACKAISKIVKCKEYHRQIGVDGVELVLDCLRTHKNDGRVVEKTLNLLENLSEEGILKVYLFFCFCYLCAFRKVQEYHWVA